MSCEIQLIIVRYDKNITYKQCRNLYTGFRNGWNQSKKLPYGSRCSQCNGHCEYNSETGHRLAEASAHRHHSGPFCLGPQCMDGDVNRLAPRRLHDSELLEV